MTTTATEPTLFKTRLDLDDNIRKSAIQQLNLTLAATFDLYSQVKQAHWNVKGENFIALHELFDDIATELNGYVDMVAERITALGGTAMGTARMASETSILPEYPLSAVLGKDHLKALAERIALYGKHVRDASEYTDKLGDLDTSDLYIEVSRAIDKRLWFIESHLY